MHKPGAPSVSDRLVAVGSTGTGKTGDLIYWLSRMPWSPMDAPDAMTYCVINYKNDVYINAAMIAGGAREIGALENIPREPGLFHVRPDTVDGSLDVMLTRAHERSKYGSPVGFLIDEGYEVGQHSKPLRRVLSQGRSLRMQTMIGTQRPVWVSRFVFSEAQFFHIHALMDEDDRKHVLKWVGRRTIEGRQIDVNYPETLPEYHSLYFDGKTRRLAVMAPVPFGDDVLNVFDARRPRKTKRV